MLFLKKQKKVQEFIVHYNEQVLICMSEFEKAVTAYIEDPDRDALHEGYKRVHQAEGKADDIRREIEVLMYSKALFPESRGDILGLIETMDRVPNQTESVVRMIHNQHIPLPKAFAPAILSMIEASCRCIKELINAVNSLFDNFMNATVYVGKIDELESEVDHIEEDLIDQIFSSREDGFIKILLRDMVRRIANITDRAENVGDRIRIIVAKRSI
jgi:predicted phosphate transport protein (TIGR00153 family)